MLVILFNARDIVLTTDHHFLIAPAEGLEQIPLDIEAAQLDDIAYFDIAGSKVQGVPGFGALALRAIVLLFVTTRTDCPDFATQCATGIDDFDDIAEGPGDGLDDDLISQRPDLGTFRESVEALIAYSSPWAILEHYRPNQGLRGGSFASTVTVSPGSIVTF